MDLIFENYIEIVIEIYRHAKNLWFQYILLLFLTLHITSYLHSYSAMAIIKLAFMEVTKKHLVSIGSNNEILEVFIIQGRNHHSCGYPSMQRQGTQVAAKLNPYFAF